MKKNIKNLYLFFIIIFTVPIIMNTYWSIWRGKELSHVLQNKRNRENISLRGGIISATGEYLAKNIMKDGSIIRFYPGGEVTGNITGYLSTSLGKSGLEYSYDDILKSQPFPLTITGLKDRWNNKLPEGYNIHLTIDTGLSRVAYNSLGENRGAVVAIKPSTGEILVMVSKPNFDPNIIEKKWKFYEENPEFPLVNRSTQGTYPPGSIFKVFVLASALEEGIITEKDSFYCPGYIDVEGHKFYCSRAHGEQNISNALANSCNVVFAEIGLKLGREKFLKYFDKFFKYDYDFPLPVTKTDLNEENLITDGLLAQTSFGQGELLLNPLEACLMVSAIANKGKIMKPFLIKEIRDNKNKLIKNFAPHILSSTVSSATANETGLFMKSVVDDGTGYRAYIDGITVAGKTGTAENAGNKSHAWFICFAPVEEPGIAISVIVEEGGQGGETAAPIAREIMLEYFEKKNY